jgi:hypothetical protein
MPVKIYECPECGQQKQTLKREIPKCAHERWDAERDCAFTLECEMVEVITAPNSKMMETTDEFRGKSKPKNQNKILKERTRNYARDHEADEMIALNNKNSLQRSGFLNKDGKRRKKIDDL